MDNNFSFDVSYDGSLVLTLDGACLQTTAKKAHREMTLALLDGRAAADGLESLVDMLESFLGTTNFARLRAEHFELTGAMRRQVRLFRNENGEVSWEVVKAT
jgi:hypothetical protein